MTAYTPPPLRPSIWRAVVADLRRLVSLGLFMSALIFALTVAIAGVAP